MTEEELTFNESDRIAYLYENKCKIELASRIVLLERELKETIDYIFKEEIETKDDRLKRLIDNLCISTH